jgi:methylglutaconyl-CoA hydratase
MNYQYLDIEHQQHTLSVWLNRPALHNAFNPDVIAELYHCFYAINQRDDVRVVVLGGRGKSFSAGADLNWMQAASQAAMADNHADAVNLAKMLHCIATLKQPTIARVHGLAFGGGMGLAAVCDICIASTTASFATSEVRLGLTPSTIGPYVIRAIGARQAARYFLTAERISAIQAQQLGLVHEVVAADQLDAKIDDIIDALLQGGPKAQHASKQLIHDICAQALPETLLEYTAQHIASVRQGQEAKDGLAAFLNKQRPSWLTHLQ